mmetsp:Transcript_8696/g.24093  ORF Transcript_8696/g.24093 Transcript_8696/m.24093 type:complete len:294 (+) Transcript_8696:158-1039(+)
MNNLGLDFHHSFSSSGGKTSGLFHDKRHGGTFIQQTKLSIGVLGVTRVSKDTSVQESTVNVTHHGSDVSAGESLAAGACSCPPLFNSFAHWLVPHLQVGFIEGVDGGRFRDLDTRLGENKFTNGFIQGEDVNTISKSQGKQSGGRVQTVGSSNKVGSRLKSVGKACSFLFCAFVSNAFRVNFTTFIVFIDTNDGSSGDTSINIGRSIKRVENSNIFSTVFNDNFLLCLFANQVNRFVFFFRGKNTQATSKTKGALQQIVGNHVKLLLIFSLDIDFSLVSKSLTRWQLGALNKV